MVDFLQIQDAPYAVVTMSILRALKNKYFANMIINNSQANIASKNQK